MRMMIELPIFLFTCVTEKYETRTDIARRLQPYHGTWVDRETQPGMGR